MLSLINCAEMSITLALPSHRGGGGDDAATAAAAATSAAAAPAAPGRRWRGVLPWTADAAAIGGVLHQPHP